MVSSELSRCVRGRGLFVMEGTNYNLPLRSCRNSRLPGLTPPRPGGSISVQEVIDRVGVEAQGAGVRRPGDASPWLRKLRFVALGVNPLSQRCFT